MDIDKQCLSVFKSFINDIIIVFPEYKIKLEDVYGLLLKLDSCNLEEQELLQEFLDRVHKLNKKITNKDETMFEDDPLLLTDISFKHIWTTNITYKTKETIWKYLQTFCLLSLNHQSNKDLQNALSNLSENKHIEIKDKKVASDVKKIKKMTENIKEPIAEDISSKEYIPSNEDSNEGNPGDNPFSQMEQMMNSSEIGKIAQQVSESLDMESMLGGDSGNPMEIFQKLLSGDAMGKIMNSIHSVVNEKVDNGELNKDTMVNEAQDLCKGMSGNPMFKAMSEMQKQQPQKPQQNQPKQSNKTQQRLQKKLKEKQKGKVQVNKMD
jgi:hypothetical protein|tara:strand:+ start:4 stop:972 length:969 start_codon:yes stop_codon:yes gene_type:complete